MLVKYIHFKNICDFIFALLMLIFIFPFLIIISVLILFIDGKPLFYVQNRVGINGKIFKILKFRTMKNNVNSNFERNVLDLSDEDLAKERLKFKTVSKNDIRITNLGKILRKLHIDELPQLINVLKGDMSFVGPRPDSPVQKNDYKGNVWQERISVKPGITGLAQLYTCFLLEERTFYDIKYKKDKNIILDFLILCRTLIKIFYFRGE
tara:strand:+ start:273 stop:896 length:624 start_codon:yes stop_codon:yes gene_type:complete